MNSINVLLVSTYEIGRQPFGIASPAAWLREVGASVTVLDLSRQPFREGPFTKADLIAFYVPMHTATRLAAKVVERIKTVNPNAHLCFFGLYAPVNEAYLRKLGAQTILGGEFEEGLVSLVHRLAKEREPDRPALSTLQPEPLISLSRLKFKVPDRSGLPILSNYARLVIGGQTRVVGYTEATRGCKHVCRHCPIVPVYEGNFRVVQQDVVIEDIRRQVAGGAQHITFGDPDFFNGPSHAVRIINEMHRDFPQLTYDVTIKIQHLIKEVRLLPILRDTGCLFVTSAVESFDPVVLEAFDKRHTREEFFRVVHNFREIGLGFNPTFVAFTPWTTLVSYLDFLSVIADLDLIESVSPIQYAIRLLIPAGSKLLDLEEVRNMVGEFDEEALLYPWAHPDPVVDQLCKDILIAVEAAQRAKASRREIFPKVWRLASAALERSTIAKIGFSAVNGDRDGPLSELTAFASKAEVPRLTENWYC
jgi:radical SAM superfamily enzyme YgiQ (UPF0313 family)